MALTIRAVADAFGLNLRTVRSWAGLGFLSLDAQASMGKTTVISRTDAEKIAFYALLTQGIGADTRFAPYAIALATRRTSRKPVLFVTAVRGVTVFVARESITPIRWKIRNLARGAAREQQ